MFSCFAICKAPVNARAVSVAADKTKMLSRTRHEKNITSLYFLLENLSGCFRIGIATVPVIDIFSIRFLLWQNHFFLFSTTSNCFTPKCAGLFGLGMGTIMECSQDGGILPVNHILLNSCSTTSNDLIDVCLNIS